jgi:hypothetical protein
MHLSPNVPLGYTQPPEQGKGMAIIELTIGTVSLVISICYSIYNNSPCPKNYLLYGGDMLCFTLDTGLSSISLFTDYSILITFHDRFLHSC